jgi:hypothetical protein
VIRAAWRTALAAAVLATVVQSAGCGLFSSIPDARSGAVTALDTLESALSIIDALLKPLAHRGWKEAQDLSALVEKAQAAANFQGLVHDVETASGHAACLAGGLGPFAASVEASGFAVQAAQIRGAAESLQALVGAAVCVPAPQNDGADAGSP